MNLDSYKLLLSGGDGGDTCHRMYTSFIRLRLLGLLGKADITAAKDLINNTAGPAETQKLLEEEDGIYIRNPDRYRWYSDSRNTSRDQLVPVICWHTVMSYGFSQEQFRKFYRRDQTELLKACLKRGMFAQNIYPNWVDPRREPVKEKTPDFMNIEIWGIFARAYLKTPWAPLALLFVLLGDLFMVFAALFKCFAPITKDGTLEFRWNDPTDVDDDNMNNLLMTAQYNFPTPLSWLARKIYKKCRKANIGNETFKEKNNIMAALMYYHRAPLGNPELAEIARPLVERY